MSTFDYPSLRVDTLELLNEFGNEIVLTREESGGEYDPVSGTFSGGVTLELKGSGVFAGYSSNEIDGTEIRATDRKLLFQGDPLQINDKYGDWRVLRINNIDPDESGAILTIVQIRE